LDDEDNTDTVPVRRPQGARGPVGTAEEEDEGGGGGGTTPRRRKLAGGDAEFLEVVNKS
jgi:hypothetical protein